MNIGFQWEGARGMTKKYLCLLAIALGGCPAFEIPSPDGGLAENFGPQDGRQEECFDGGVCGEDSSGGPSAAGRGGGLADGAGGTAGSASIGDAGTFDPGLPPLGQWFLFAVLAFAPSAADGCSVLPISMSPGRADDRYWSAFPIKFANTCSIAVGSPNAGGKSPMMISASFSTAVACNASTTRRTMAATSTVWD